MRLILVRHGQTEWNQLGIIQGRTDIPLNDTGIVQARAAGEWLSQRRIDAVYSSPMQRAFDTATEIARPHGLPVISIDDIIEIDFGLWEEKTADELKRLYPEYWNDWSWHLDEEKSANMQAESAYTILNRVKRALNSIFEENTAGSTAVVVSHTMPIKLIMANAIGLPLKSLQSIKVGNCGICELDMNTDMSGGLITWNESGYLARKGLI